ncbi:MAG TPA: type 1 glutamine amidotransferase domain-containing protein [Candidatus Dormibacteraeota bacterium]|nr:type 1 glutamine amidotransferase domain-containing protein [Candidatus Dormibacteraeota bacterium]
MKIACLLAEDFEDSEFQEPYEKFQLAGHVVTVIGSEAHVELTGAKGEVRTSTDQAIGEVKPEDFGALFLPGGYSPDRLRADERMVEFVKDFMDHGKPVMAICHGPQLLLSARRVGGRRMTAWKTVQDDLRQAGSEVVDEPAVVDRNLVTSRQPDDIPAFVAASLELIER